MPDYHIYISIQQRLWRLHPQALQIDLRTALTSLEHSSIFPITITLPIEELHLTLPLQSPPLHREPLQNDIPNLKLIRTHIPTHHIQLQDTPMLFLTLLSKMFVNNLLLLLPRYHPPRLTRLTPSLYTINARYHLSIPVTNNPFVTPICRVY